MKNDKAILLLGGTAVVAALLMMNKKKTPAITSSKNGKELPPSQTPPPETLEEASGDEKKYLDFYYNLGWYKLQEMKVTTQAGEPPVVQEITIPKGNQSDAQWLTNVAYWAMYTNVGNEHNTNAPWNVTVLDHTNPWYKTWMRMYGYAQKLFGKP